MTVSPTCATTLVVSASIVIGYVASGTLISWFRSSPLNLASRWVRSALTTAQNLTARCDPSVFRVVRPEAPGYCPPPLPFGAGHLACAQVVDPGAVLDEDVRMGDEIAVPG